MLRRLKSRRRGAGASNASSALNPVIEKKVGAIHENIPTPVVQVQAADSVPFTPEVRDDEEHDVASRDDIDDVSQGQNRAATADADNVTVISYSTAHLIAAAKKTISINDNEGQRQPTEEVICEECSFGTDITDAIHHASHEKEIVSSEYMGVQRMSMAERLSSTLLRDTTLQNVLASAKQTFTTEERYEEEAEEPRIPTATDDATLDVTEIKEEDVEAEEQYPHSSPDDAQSTYSSSLTSMFERLLDQGGTSQEKEESVAEDEQHIMLVHEENVSNVNQNNDALSTNSMISGNNYMMAHEDKNNDIIVESNYMDVESSNTRNSCMENQTFSSTLEILNLGCGKCMGR